MCVGVLKPVGSDTNSGQLTSELPGSTLGVHICCQILKGLFDPNTNIINHFSTES